MKQGTGPAAAIRIDGRPELSAGAGPIVGLVWARSPTNRNDRRKSIPFPFLAPLLDVAGVRFVSLQLGERAGDLLSLPQQGAVLDVSARLGDFADTAAAVSRLDLVIAVNTAVAHLAGTLGKPVWVMLSSVCDWRWLVERPDSPWYPTMRLFRQPARGEWTSVIAAVSDALRRFVPAQAAGGARQLGTFPDFVSQ